MERLRYLLFSFEGRIGRKSYFLGALALVIAMIIYVALTTFIFSAIITRFNSEATIENSVIAMKILPWHIFAYPSFALMVKRCHDLGKLGWWSLIAVVPIIGGLIAFIWFSFFKGTVGENRFGADPLQNKVI